MKIILDNEQPTSLNKVVSRAEHWSKRSERLQATHMLVWSKTSRLQRFHEPVSIRFTVFFKNKGKVFDVDNIIVKEYIDGLKKYVLVDDTPEYVKEVTIRYGGRDLNPRVEIELFPI